MILKKLKGYFFLVIISAFVSLSYGMSEWFNLTVGGDGYDFDLDISAPWGSPGVDIRLIDSGGLKFEVINNNGYGIVNLKNFTPGIQYDEVVDFHNTQNAPSITEVSADGIYCLLSSNGKVVKFRISSISYPTVSVEADYDFDTTGPSILNLKGYTDRVEILFNEQINSTDVLNKSNYILEYYEYEGYIQVNLDSTTFFYDPAPQNEKLIIKDLLLPYGVEFRVTLSTDIHDIAGNMVSNPGPYLSNVEFVTLYLNGDGYNFTSNSYAPWGEGADIRFTDSFEYPAIEVANQSRGILNLGSGDLTLINTFLNPENYPSHLSPVPGARYTFLNNGSIPVKIQIFNIREDSIEFQCNYDYGMTSPQIFYTTVSSSAVKVYFNTQLNSTSTVNSVNYTLESPIGTPINLSGANFIYDGNTINPKVIISGLNLTPSNDYSISGNLYDLFDNNNIDYYTGTVNQPGKISGTVTNNSSSSGNVWVYLGYGEPGPGWQPIDSKFLGYFYSMQSKPYEFNLLEPVTGYTIITILDKKTPYRGDFDPNNGDLELVTKNINLAPGEDKQINLLITEITVMSPNGGENWQAGTVETVHWTSSPGVGDVSIDISTDGGMFWSNIIGNTPNDGSETIIVPPISSNNCKIRVSETDGAPYDVSDGYFTIINPTIDVIYPEEYVQWEAGTTQTVIWISTGNIGNMNIDLSTDDGESWVTLKSNVSNSGQETIIVPDTPSSTCRIRVMETDGDPFGISSVFSIFGPEITVMYPNGNLTWTAGMSEMVSWSWSGTINYVNIDISTNGGANWTNLVSNLANSGNASIIVPNTPSNSCLIRVSDTDGTPYDVSDSPFMIIEPGITLTYPAGDEQWSAGSIQTVTWTWTGSVGNLNIDISTDGGTNWTNLVQNTINDGSQTITVPDTPSNSCVIRVSETDGTPSDQNFVFFTILSGAGTITVMYPNGFENWTAGMSERISWTWNGTINYVNIDISTNGGVSWTNLVSNITNFGSASIIVPDTPSNSCLIRVSDTDGSPSDVSDSFFTIQPSGGESIMVMYPNGFENWTAGMSEMVSWSWNGNIGPVNIELSTNGGNTWMLLVSNTVNDGYETITVPDIQSNSCLIKVSETDGTPYDVSDAFFSIGLYQGGPGGPSYSISGRVYYYGTKTGYIIVEAGQGDIYGSWYYPVSSVEVYRSSNQTSVPYTIYLPYSGGNFIVKAGLDYNGDHYIDWYGGDEPKGKCSEEQIYVMGNETGKDIVLYDPASISGYVKNSNGIPVNNAQVNFKVKKYNHEYNYWYEDVIAHVLTDSSGYYQLFASISSGTYMIEVIPPENTFYTVEKREITISAGQTVTNFNFTLNTGCSISGRVTDPYGNPLMWAWVWAGRNWNYGGSQEPGYSGCGQTDENGNYLIKGLKPSYYDIEVTPPEGMDFVKGKVNNYQIFPGTITYINFQLKTGGKISGRVVLPDGSPSVYSGINAWIETEFGGENQISYWTQTDNSGQYTINLPEGTWTIEATPQLDKPFVASQKFRGIKVVSGETINKDFYLKPGGIITGQVLLSNNQPAQRSEVEFQNIDMNLWYGARTSDESGYSDGENLGAPGKFKRTHLPAGNYRIWVYPPEGDAYKYETRVSTQVYLEAGQTLQLNFKLDTGGIISGVITNYSELENDLISGIEMKPVMVIAFSTTTDFTVLGRKTEDIRSEADVNPFELLNSTPPGKFELRNLPAGTYDIYLLLMSKYPGSVNYDSYITVGARYDVVVQKNQTLTDQDLTASFGNATLSGDVRSDDGGRIFSPVQEGGPGPQGVGLIEKDTGHLVGVSNLTVKYPYRDDIGSYLLKNLTLGVTYYAQAYAKGYKVKPATITINSLENTYDFILESPKNSISGNVNYQGNKQGKVIIGVFDNPEFNGDPLRVVTIPQANTQWTVSGLPNGVFYIAAFMDVNDNNSFDPYEPSGVLREVYGNERSRPLGVSVFDGITVTGKDFLLTDPVLNTVSGIINFTGYEGGIIYAQVYKDGLPPLGKLVVEKQVSLRPLGSLTTWYYYEFNKLVPSGSGYKVFTYLDMNQNHVLDETEPVGASAQFFDVPADTTTPVKNINLEIKNRGIVRGYVIYQTDYQSFTGQVILQAWSGEPFKGQPIATKIQAYPGEYSFSIIEGNYTLTAFIDNNRNGKLDRDFAGRPLEPSGTVMDMITVYSGTTIYGIDILIKDIGEIGLYAIKGKVLYSGNNKGKVTVAVFRDALPVMPEYVPGTPPVAAIVMDTTGYYQINNLVEGRYYVGAFMDIDGNNQFDGFEPQGAYTAGNIYGMPQEIYLNTLEKTGIDIILKDFIVPSLSILNVNLSTTSFTPDFDGVNDSIDLSWTFRSNVDLNSANGKVIVDTNRDGKFEPFNWSEITWNENGNPVKDGKVLTWDELDALQSNSDWSWDEWVAPGILRKELSGNNTYYLYDAIANWDGRNNIKQLLGPATYQIRIEYRTPSWQNFVSSVTYQGLSVYMGLGNKSAISGKVTYKTAISSGPVKGARVSVQTGEYAITDPLGNYIISGLEPGIDYQVQVESKKYVGEKLIISGSSITAGNVLSGVDFELEGGVSVYGRVILPEIFTGYYNETGGYVRELWGGVSAVEIPPATPVANWIPRTDQASFVIYEGTDSVDYSLILAPGKYTINVYTDKYKGTNINIEISSVSLRKDIKLLDNVYIAGYISIPETAINNLQIGITAESKKPVSFQGTGAIILKGDTSSYYRITGILPNTTYYLRYHETTNLYADGDLTVFVGTGSLENVNFQLSNGATLKGNLIAGDTRDVKMFEGDTLSTFDIQIMAQSPELNYTRIQTLTILKSTGGVYSYSITGIKPNTRYFVGVNAKGFQTYYSSGTQWISGNVEINVTGENIYNINDLKIEPFTGTLLVNILEGNALNVNVRLPYWKEWEVLQLSSPTVIGTSSSTFIFNNLGTGEYIVTVNGVSGSFITRKAVENNKESILDVILTTTTLKGYLISSTTEYLNQVKGKRMFALPLRVYWMLQDMEAAKKVAKSGIINYDGVSGSTASYEIAGLSEDVYMIFPGTGVLSIAGCVPSNISIPLSKGENIAPPIELKPGYSITGTIERQIAGIEENFLVSLYEPGKFEPLLTQRVVFKNMGTFNNTINNLRANFTLKPVTGSTQTVSGTTPGKKYILRVLSEQMNYKIFTAEVNVIDKNINLGTISLLKGADLKGKLVDAKTNQPVTGTTGAKVIVQAVPWVDGGYRETDENNPALKIDGTTGEFIFKNLPAGNYTLTVKFLSEVSGIVSSVKKYAGTVISGITVPDTPQTVDIGTIKIKPGSTISGTVKDTSGRPLANIRITAKPSQIRGEVIPEEAKTDFNGYYCINNIDPDVSYWDVTAAIRPHWTEGYELVPEYGQQTKKAVKPGSTNVDFILIRADANIYGSITNTDIKLPAFTGYTGMPGAFILLQKTDEISGNPMDGIKTVTKPDRTFEIRNVVPGTYILKIMAEGKPPYEKLISLYKGDDLHLPPITITDEGKELYGRILTPEGKKITTSVADTIIAISTDFAKIIFGNFDVNPVTLEIDKYSICGLVPGVYHIVLVGNQGRNITVVETDYVILADTATTKQELNIQYVDEPPHFAVASAKFTFLGDTCFFIKGFITEPVIETNPEDIISIDTGNGVLSNYDMGKDKQSVSAIYTLGTGETVFKIAFSAHDFSGKGTKEIFTFDSTKNVANNEVVNPAFGGSGTIGDGDSSGMQFGPGTFESSGTLTLTKVKLILEKEGGQTSITAMRFGEEKKFEVPEIKKFAIPNNLILKSGIYDFKVEAIGGLFASLVPGKKVKIELEYDPSLTDEEIANLEIFREESPGKWSESPITDGRTIDTENHTISAYTTHLSKFAAFIIVPSSPVVSYTGAFKTYPWPNPTYQNGNFYDNVNIKVCLPEEPGLAGVDVKLKIYNVAGELIYEKVENKVPGTSSDIRWDLINNKGNKVASGAYIYFIEFTNKTYEKKIDRNSRIGKIAVIR